MCLAAAAAAPLAGEIVDRIAVSVGNRVITAEDVNREIRVVAFLNGAKPDLSPAARRATADRMVEQKLIGRELEVSRYPAPSAAEVEGVLDKFRREHYPNDGDYRRALAEYSISEQDVRDELLWQRALLAFVDFRFRPGVQVSEAELQDYFDKVVKPAAQAAHPGEPVALDDFRGRIEDAIAGPRVDQEVDRWLREARGRTEIVYRDEVFQ